MNDEQYHGSYGADRAKTPARVFYRHRFRRLRVRQYGNQAQGVLLPEYYQVLGPASGFEVRSRGRGIRQPVFEMAWHQSLAGADPDTGFPESPSGSLPKPLQRAPTAQGQRVHRLSQVPHQEWPEGYH